MDTLTYTPDTDLKVHHEGAIKLLCQQFLSHENGLPEWVKNSTTAYLLQSTEPERRIVVLIFNQPKVGSRGLISCLDFVGMTSYDIENYFRHWADPEAMKKGTSKTDLLGGHGNGGKCYMTQMFDDYSTIETVKGDKGNRYGVKSGSVRFGYVPSPQSGKDFSVPDRRSELDRLLKEINLSFSTLPAIAKESFEKGDGFTIVKGFNPKDYKSRIPIQQLVDALCGHSQMIRPLQLCKILVLVMGTFLTMDSHFHFLRSCRWRDSNVLG